MSHLPSFSSQGTAHDLIVSVNRGKLHRTRPSYFLFGQTVAKLQGFSPFWLVEWRGTNVSYNPENVYPIGIPQFETETKKCTKNGRFWTIFPSGEIIIEVRPSSSLSIGVSPFRLRMHYLLSTINIHDTLTLEFIEETLQHDRVRSLGPHPIAICP